MFVGNMYAFCNLRYPNRLDVSFAANDEWLREGGRYKLIARGKRQVVGVAFAEKRGNVSSNPRVFFQMRGNFEWRWTHAS